MKIKMMLATAAIVAMTGASFAQGTGGTGSAGNNSAAPTGTQNEGEAMTYASEAEETMWTTNRDYLGGFFTDETMSEMRSEEEVTAAYGGLTADQQAQLKADCDAAELNRGNYGEVSLTLCSQLGAL